jgi:hypothetical protein
VLILELLSGRQSEEKLGTVVILAHEIKYLNIQKREKNIRILTQSETED